VCVERFSQDAARIFPSNLRGNKQNARVKILFIGGTGNISSDCADLLCRNGHEIGVVSRGISAVPADYRAFIADRKDPEALRRVLEGYRPDVVINFLGFDLPELQIDYALFRDAVRQYVFISSATVYARPAPLPIVETSPLGNRFWDYARKKQGCEEWLMERWTSAQFPVTIVRPSHTYSRLWVPNPVSSSSFTYAARLEKGRPVYVPDDGQNPWTLTATTDFAVGLAGLVGNPQAIGEAVHITSDEVLTWNQICAEIARAVGVEPPAPVRVPTDFICEVAPRFTGGLKGDKSNPGVFDNSKIKRLVPGFSCRKPFRDGVRESVAWLRAHPEHQNLSQELDVLMDRIITEWQTRSGA
jgi:nucleoside-diphosphate-sugar epimerase